VEGVGHRLLAFVDLPVKRRLFEHYPSNSKGTTFVLVDRLPGLPAKPEAHLSLSWIVLVLFGCHFLKASVALPFFQSLIHD